jgi:hypothetical protein
MVVVSAATNRSALVPFSARNDNGYLLTLPTGAAVNATQGGPGREFWIHFRLPSGLRSDPASIT